MNEWMNTQSLRNDNELVSSAWAEKTTQTKHDNSFKFTTSISNIRSVKVLPSCVVLVSVSSVDPRDLVPFLDSLQQPTLGRCLATSQPKENDNHWKPQFTLDIKLQPTEPQSNNEATF